MYQMKLFWTAGRKYLISTIFSDNPSLKWRHGNEDIKECALVYRRVADIAGDQGSTFEANVAMVGIGSDHLRVHAIFFSDGIHRRLVLRLDTAEVFFGTQTCSDGIFHYRDMGDRHGMPAGMVDASS